MGGPNPFGEYGYQSQENPKKDLWEYQLCTTELYRQRAKLVLEPEWEAKFEDTSYGFRPGRNAHDAIGRIFQAICKTPKWVLDADISKCFDCIKHKALLNKLECPKPLKKQIAAWLKAGVLENNKYSKYTAGTPQGGVISPLLANIARLWVD